MRNTNKKLVFLFYFHDEVPSTEGKRYEKIAKFLLGEQKKSLFSCIIAYLIVYLHSRTREISFYYCTNKTLSNTFMLTMPKADICFFKTMGATAARETRAAVGNMVFSPPPPK